MTYKITNPWIAFTNEHAYKAFMEYKSDKGIAIADTYDAGPEYSVQLGDDFTTTELDELWADFEAWHETFHKDKLVREFETIAKIVGTEWGTLEELHEKLSKMFECSEIDECNNLFDINTSFFEYTVSSYGECGHHLCEDVSVYCYGGDQIGEAECRYGDNGELSVRYRSF